jgi:hypothetical protein
MVMLHRQLDRLEAIVTAATGVFDTDGAWQFDGAYSAAAWISRRCHRPHGAARAEVAVARVLRHLPVSAAAWLAGDISADHVRALARVRRPATEARLADDEEMLVDQATRLPFHHFTKVVAYWAQHADPDGADDAAHDQIDRRRCHFSQSFGGMWYGDQVFDPISGAIVAKELRRLEDDLFDTDWAEARDRLGREPTICDLVRTAAQRRADALVEMAVRSATAPADGRRPEPLFTVLVGWETLNGRICQLANGSVVAPAALAPWLKSAWLERVVFNTRSRVIDVGVTRRLFAGATRRAVLVRDQECFHDFCDVAADQCQVDHIVAYADGGPTEQSNGRPACGFHNRQRHRPSQPGPPDRGPPGAPPA